MAIVPWLASAQTTYLYDGFNYAEGALATVSGGAWTGGWDSVGVTSPGLVYPGLSAVGNKASTGAGGVGGGKFYMMPTGFSAMNSTVWISFLAKADTSAGADWSGVSTFNGESAESLFLGNPGGQGGASRYWGAHVYNVMGDPGVPDGPQISPISVDNQIFAVAKIVNGASSANLTLWVNPSVESEPTLGDALLTGTVGRIPFDRVRIAGSSDGVVNYDELRVGDSYFAVVPEPTTIALLGLGGLALTLLRRRN